jgi:hypothetical protein
MPLRQAAAGAAAIAASEGGRRLRAAGGRSEKALGLSIRRNGKLELFSRQTRLAGWRGTAPKAGAKRLSVHHKHAFSRSGAIKGAECLHGLVQCVAVRD